MKGKNRDTAYMLTPQNHHIKFPFKMDNENIYSVGSHNGHSTYNFTSAENAVQNALHWANEYLDSSDGSQSYHKIRWAWTLNHVILIIALVIIIVWFRTSMYSALSTLGALGAIKRFQRMLKTLFYNNIT